MSHNTAASRSSLLSDAAVAATVERQWCCSYTQTVIMSLSASWKVTWHSTCLCRCLFISSINGRNQCDWVNSSNSLDCRDQWGITLTDWLTSIHCCWGFNRLWPEVTVQATYLLFQGSINAISVSMQFGTLTNCTKNTHIHACMLTCTLYRYFQENTKRHTVLHHFWMSPGVSNLLSNQLWWLWGLSEKLHFAAMKSRIQNESAA